MLTRRLAVDHGRDVARANCLCTGLIGIDMADWIRHDEEALARWSSTIPGGWMGATAQIAGRLAFPSPGQPSCLHGAVPMPGGGGSA